MFLCIETPELCRRRERNTGKEMREQDGVQSGAFAAKGARLLDLLGDFLFTGRLQIKKLLLQLLEAERTDLEFFCHFYDRSFHNRSGRKRPVFTVIQQTLYRAKIGMSREFLGDFADCGL